MSRVSRAMSRVMSMSRVSREGCQGVKGRGQGDGVNDNFMKFKSGEERK